MPPRNPKLGLRHDVSLPSWATWNELGLVRLSAPWGVDRLAKREHKNGK